MLLKPTCEALARNLGNELIKKKYTVATAESCTGGLIGATITAIPGSSLWFRGGIIAYSESIKTAFLDVPPATLTQYGAVSYETVEMMAGSLAKKMESDSAIAVSGIAGPGGGTREKPVGLVFIGVYCLEEILVYRHIFQGDRSQVREQTVHTSLQHLIALVKRQINY